MKPTASILFGVLAVSVSTEVLAQAVAAPPPAEQQTNLPPSVSADEGIQDIIVTATRREERLQDIPVAVTAITEGSLAAGGIDSTRELTQAVPGLFYARSGAGGQPIIRGVGPGQGASNGDEPSVATYIDGVYQPDPYGNIIDLVEVQRVEVLRGPQGTVFGRNATGGLINIITPDPSFITRGKVTASYGRTRNSADSVMVSGYVTGPLSETFAADLAVRFLDEQGYVKHLVLDDTVGGRDAIDVRGKLLFEPSENAQIILTGALTDYNSAENIQQPVDGNTVAAGVPGVIIPDDPWETSVDFLPLNNFNRHSLSLRTTFDLGAVNLETTGAYIYSKVRQVSDSDATNIPIRIAGPDPFETKSYSQEVRLLSTGAGRLNWLLGLYAFRLDSGGLIPNLAGTPSGGYAGPTFVPDVQTTSYAVFGEGTYQLAEPLFLTVGARYTTEERSFEQKLLDGSVLIPEDSFEVDKLTYRVALRYEINEDTNIYASYGTGFKSGVYNTITSTLNRVDPETLKAAEVGLKADISSNLRINIAGYHYDYSNMQVSARSAVGVNFVLQNAADSEIYGGEVELTAYLTDELSLSASAAYTHAQYENFPLAQTFVAVPGGGNAAVTADVSGNQMIKTPEYTFSIGPNWEHQMGAGVLDVSANLYHSAKIYWDFANRVAQPSYTTISAQVGYEIDDLRLFVAGTNLTNEVHYQQLRVGAQALDAILARPREIRVGAEYRF